MEEVKVEVVRREVIKPSSPSTHDRLQLSILDLTYPALYVPVIFFYKAEDLVTVSPEVISGKLKSSLSKTLSRFYPLAGRVDGASISCNDEGAVFSEARTDLLLSDFLRNINNDSLEGLCPTSPGDSPTEWPLLGVMVTFFGSSSGVAVSVSVSHRVCDAASLLTFVKDWATTTAKGKFVFESSKIAELKRQAASETVPLPTRVEAISALVWRCAKNASRSNLLVPRPTLMSQAMDLRLRIPSTRDTFGNLQTSFSVKKSDLEVCDTVAAFRKAKEGVNEMIKENHQSNTLGQYLLSVMGSFVAEVKPDIDFYPMTSWCGKPFYEVDFGWGCPVWIGIVQAKMNMVYAGLIDTKDGEGVEASINLPEQDMTVFLRDQDLLAYAVLNPPVLI
ncbi:hypothetical protein AALP_AA3G258300 [Arabis alpina]|uniref:BAHD acyltransferase n=1 Tax=Arabis alpina TaxID=50452 RepID=A0A087HBP4_ARAAL|nr:hypothetical protein AALP_AA3G258300 [Arabis alpina]